MTSIFCLIKLRPLSYNRLQAHIYICLHPINIVHAAHSFFFHNLHHSDVRHNTEEMNLLLLLFHRDLKLVLLIYQDYISIWHKTEREGRGHHLFYMVCCTQTGTETHTPSNTYTMSQSSFGTSAGSSVRVTAIYSVPSISTDYTWSLPTHPPSQTQLSPSDTFSQTPKTEVHTLLQMHI